MITNQIIIIITEASQFLHKHRLSYQILNFKFIFRSGRSIFSSLTVGVIIIINDYLKEIKLYDKF